MTAEPSSVLLPAGPAAAAIAEMSWVLFIGGGVVFAVVMAVLAWSLFGRRESRTSATRSQLAWVVGGGIAFPVVVLSALLVYATLRTAGLATGAEANGPVLSVTGRMWWWEVRYRDPASGREIALANEIHLPAGRAVTVGINSADVIHSVWIPELAGKVDAMPGQVRQLRLEADVPGVHRGQCAEFCGMAHARMALRVVVHAPADYARWLAAEARPAAPPTSELARRGQAIFVRERCAACHTIRGGPGDDTTDGAAAGPDLTHVGSRELLAAGSVRADAAGFRDWIAHSQRIKPGARMPEYERLGDESLQALAAYLEQLK